MTPELEKPLDIWRDDFEGMAESVHSYILNSLDEEIEYAEISGDRREVETGYNYSTEGLEFKFSLAGTFNSDPQILKNGKRKIVLQAEERDEAYRDILEDLEKQNDSQIKEKQYGELEVYELEIDSPYT